MTEEQFICKNLLRKQAACIVHEFLREQLEEEDEPDVSEAMKLRDLYDCRVCAGHVMQVYVKGIMDGHRTAEGYLIFGMDEEISAEEAENIRMRMFHKELRNPKVSVKKNSKQNLNKAHIDQEEAQRLLKNIPRPILVDVRTARDYEEGHIKGAEHISFTEIMKNPYAVGGHRDDVILVYCEAGEQSRIAAGCLLEAGYEQVYYFAWKSN